MSAPDRVVVVGAGMAAAHLADGLAARGVPVTVLGDEPHRPYNRILLSAVLEGTHDPGALALSLDGRVDLRTGTRVVDVRRDEREVELADRSRVPYAALVLATGSIPTLPPVRGVVRVDGTLHPKVHAFRSLDDCHRLLAALPSARRAVVVGGGLLGLQVARALAVRGLATEVVEGGDHLLRSQVGPAAGSVLARGLQRLGTAVYCGARAVRLTDAGLVLDSGYVLDTDLVVLTAGGRPSTALARRAGLTVRRGVVVDEGLASVDDPRVHAIGDCAEHGGRTTGFVAPAWEQATVLADRLAGQPAAYPAARSAPSYTGTRTVARLRATGLDVAVLGDPQHETGDEVVVTNPVAGSHRSIVVRDGRVVAATLVGDLSRVGLITQCYDRGRRLGPDEPARLLMGERTAPATTPEWQLPDDAEVCACAGVTAGAVRRCGSLDDVRASTRATTGCGGCAPTVRQLLATRPALTG